MQTIDVTETVPMPIERAFERLADHANYSLLPGITRAELLEDGSPSPNGLGAVRRVALGGVVLDEEITGFDPPRHLAYRVIASRPIRVVHEGGRIELTAVPAGTRIRWRSTFRIAIPVIGGFVGRRAARRFERGFRQLLRALPALEDSRPPASRQPSVARSQTRHGTRARSAPYSNP